MKTPHWLRMKWWSVCTHRSAFKGFGSTLNFEQAEDWGYTIMRFNNDINTALGGGGYTIHWDPDGVQIFKDKTWWAPRRVVMTFKWDDPL